MSPRPHHIAAWLPLSVAVVLLNATLTFHNVWPTPYIHWTGELSVEIAALLLLLAVYATQRRLPQRLLCETFAVLLIVALLGRYGEVTAPALYGREVNLYWDLRHLGSVVAMFGRVAPPWALVAGAIALLLLFTLLYQLLRWALRCLIDALQRHRALRAGTVTITSVLIALFVVQRLDDRVPRLLQFSIPVSNTYAAQIGHVLDAFGATRAARRLPPSPLLASGFDALHGGDVLLVFLESYGRVTYDRPEFARIIAPARERLLAAARASGFDMVSGYVTSPTFGGSSWLAHVSLLSGIETRDPEGYDLLMAQSRASLPSLFRTAGYRSIALMPGLKSHWPEGEFYHFDHIYDDDGLGYTGPAFGWWRIPDQFTLAKLDAREMVARDRRPLFVFYPTINTHTPFRPTPPLQPDWSRLLTSRPYDAAALQASLAQTSHWMRMGSRYAGAVAASFDVLTSYLPRHSGRNLVLIVLGDHQPPAAVSGASESWDVPVHIIARAGPLLAGLRTRGFVAGNVPPDIALGPMSALAPLLLQNFAAPEQDFPTCPEAPLVPLSSTRGGGDVCPTPNHGSTSAVRIAPVHRQGLPGLP
ncbi:MAG: hypothetical protein ABIT36_11125 [Steroidobacteraceae bacterium]